MIHRSHFVNKLRLLDYTFKARQKRTELYRRKGGTHYVSVPLADLLEEEFVTFSLRQAGCTAEEIKAFLAASRS